MRRAGAAALALAVGLLVVVIVTSSASSRTSGDLATASSNAFALTNPPLPPAPEPVEPDAAIAPPGRQDDAPEPTTAIQVLPKRCLEGEDTLPTRPGPCDITNYGPERPTVVIWGDSHAWQQVPALRAQAERTRTNLVAFIMGACPPMDLRGTGFRGLCVKQSQEALAFVDAKLERGSRIKVALGGFWELYRDYHARAEAGWAPLDPHDQFLIARSELFAEGGGRLFGTLARDDVPTAAIAQAPWVSETAPDCSAGEQPYACDLIRSSAIPSEARTARWVKDQLARIRLSGYIDTSRFLCNALVCRAAIDGEPVYLDELHLDPAITSAFAPEYRDLFR